MSNVTGNKSNILSIKQKQELVNRHYNENRTFRELSIEYGVSYSTARNLCINYKIYGAECLISKTGKHNKHSSVRPNSLDPKDKELAILKKKIKWLEMENEVIKKFNEMMENQKKK
ncbi:hypothetical protein [Spiroplasma endosymbiont of Cantharis nigra]|uniref:hypothetical protein n=1 Tax=Spiroplasma endosymbiont of Cantharis nigra TaxID=3066278 RepID=UPI0030D1F825